MVAFQFDFSRQYWAFMPYDFGGWMQLVSGSYRLSLEATTAFVINVCALRACKCFFLMHAIPLHPHPSKKCTMHHAALKTQFPRSYRKQHDVMTVTLIMRLLSQCKTAKLNDAAQLSCVKVWLEISRLPSYVTTVRYIIYVSKKLFFAQKTSRSQLCAFENTTWYWIVKFAPCHWRRKIRSQYPLNWRLNVPKQVWTLWKNENLCSSRQSNHDFTVRSLAASNSVEAYRFSYLFM
jgi:hypothetical protein